jgi:hypothetical protein
MATTLRDHLEYKQQARSSDDWEIREAKKFGLRRDVDLDLVIALVNELATITHTSWDRKYPVVGEALDEAKDSLDLLLGGMLHAWQHRDDKPNSGVVS